MWLLWDIVTSLYCIYNIQLINTYLVSSNFPDGISSDWEKNTGEILTDTESLIVAWSLNHGWLKSFLGKVRFKTEVVACLKFQRLRQ